MKKLLTMLLAACLLCTFFAFTASAETLTGTCGDDAFWSLDTDTGVLTVSGTGAMADYAAKGQPYYIHRASITSVVIEEGITNVGAYAFDRFGTGLTSVTIPSSVKTIKNDAFDFNSLTEVIIPEGVERIEEYAFAANKLTKVVLPNSISFIAPGAFLLNDGAVFHCSLNSYAHQWAVGNGYNTDPKPLTWWEKLPNFLQWLMRIFLFGWIWMR